MAGRPSKKAKEAKAQAEAAAKTYDDFAGDDSYSDDVPTPGDAGGEPRRDWRDVEKYREARDLKKLVDEDLESYLFREGRQQRRGKV